MLSDGRVGWKKECSILTDRTDTFWVGWLNKKGVFYAYFESREKVDGLIFIAFSNSGLSLAS